MVATNQTTASEAAVIHYNLVQHETTGDLWAIKHRSNRVLGARRFRQEEQPFIEDLPFLVYDVGTAREYAEEFKDRFALWPFTRTRASNPAPAADN